MEDPFDDLEADHRVIDKVLSALEATTPENTDLGFFRSVIDFVEQFADGCHHEKEEAHLFPALVSAGILNEMGPIGVMLQEHQQGRAHRGRLADLLATGDLEALCAEGRAYAALMREHIMKEEQALFMMGRTMLPPSGHELVAQAFDSIESAAAMRERHELLADALCEQVGAVPVSSV